MSAADVFVSKPKVCAAAVIQDNYYQQDTFVAWYRRGDGRAQSALLSFHKELERQVVIELLLCTTTTYINIFCSNCYEASRLVITSTLSCFPFLIFLIAW